MKTKTSLKLSTRSANDKVVFAEGIVTAMTGNASFPNPVPALAAVTQAATDLENALNSNTLSNKAKATLVDTNASSLDDTLTLLALYVDSIAKGDANIILSSGMPVRATRVPSQIPAAPINVSALNTTVEGEVMVSWDKALYALVYVIEISSNAAVTTLTPNLAAATAPATTASSSVTWIQVDIVAHTKYTITGLSSGTKYAIRIYAVGIKGTGNRSASVIVKVL